MGRTFEVKDTSLPRRQAGVTLAPTIMQIVGGPKQKTFPNLATQYESPIWYNTIPKTGLPLFLDFTSPTPLEN
jgi:hypothetical protein